MLTQSEWRCVTGVLSPILSLQRTTCRRRPAPAEEATGKEQRAQLQCGPEVLRTIFRSAGRGDYPRLEEVMAGEQRPAEGQPVGMPTLFSR